MQLLGKCSLINSMRNTLRTNDDLLAQLQSSHSLNNQIQKQKSEL